MAQAKKLSELITGGGMIVAPGAYDCITARLIEQAGFAAVYMTGAGTSAAHGLSRLRPRHHERDGRQRPPHHRLASSCR